MAAYLPLVVMMILAGGFAATTFLASRMLQPRRPTAAKEAPYESGIVPSSPPAERFPVRFYLVAMIFIIFDIEIIFTYPWAVIYSHDLGKYGLVEMVVFTIAVFVSLLYLVSNGALDWGPVKRAVRGAPSGPERTTTSTVRRTAKPMSPASAAAIEAQADAALEPVGVAATPLEGGADG
ncbi:MAG TPA: NADH-quinone oxidoreductase subunit A [Acidimicrobiales bacterium]